MIKLHSLYLTAAFVVSLAQTSWAEIPKEVAETQKMVLDCIQEERDVCIVFGATKIMTSADALTALYNEDPESLIELVKNFEKASFRVSSEGRPDFRKFLSENAIWTADFYNERFLSQVDEEYSYEEVRHYYSAYQLLRAKACDDLKNDPCAESALWSVKNAENKDWWGKVVERFGISDAISVSLKDTLFEKYKGRF